MCGIGNSKKLLTISGFEQDTYHTRLQSNVRVSDGLIIWMGGLKQEIRTEVRKKNPVEMDFRADTRMTVGLLAMQNVRSSEEC
jgi:hypothetical protein